MNPRFAKITATALLAGAMTVACGSKSQGPLLKGHIEGLGKDSQAYICYSYYGDVQSMNYDKIDLDSLGDFVFNPEMPQGVDFMEVEINIDGTNYGAYVEKGATSEMSLVLDDNAEYGTATFSGDNADVSNAVNVASQAYDFMRYFSMDPEDAKTPDEYSALLESENTRVLSALDAISDSDKKEYYTTLFDLKYMSQKMSNLASRLRDQRKAMSLTDMLADPEYKAMYDRIDISDPMMVKANLSGIWININSPYEYNWTNPDVDSLIMNLQFIDENIKEPLNRRAALQSAPFFFIEKSKPSKADAEKYMAAFSKVAADYPEVIERYRKDVDGIVELNNGDMMPYYPTLTDTEGNQVKLTDLLGKVTYIDIWATWCGPCCREIPYLEEVVKRFKGNDKLQFISISVDSDLDAWHKKLDNDKPEWPQYVLSEDEQKAFMSALGIQGIPRFILLDAEGRFIQNDAVRPSDDNIDQVLNEAVR